MNLDQFFARLKLAAGSLSGRQLTSLSIAFLAVVGVTIGSAYWLNTPTYGVLFSDLDAESASSIVAKLKTAKVDYLLDDGGKTVRVPTNRMDELRLQFASDGMPGSGHVGFELFDRTAFGVTDFLEHVNYRRALEGELGRTIGTISEVASARVHIAMPQPSLFTGRDQPTKASVVLKLRSNRQLLPSTVTAITGLVSASVESLRPESVVIIDNYGRPLSKNSGADEAAEGVPLERQQEIEHELSARVIGLLEPIVGDGRVRVNVSAKLKSDTREETEERWDPTPVMRSQQSVSQVVGGASAAQGVAGTRSNLPPDASKPEGAPAVASVTAGAPGTHLAETTNYELSKLTRHSLQPRGDIAKLSVAVLLDDDHSGVAAQAGANPAAAPGQAAAPAAQTKPRTPADLEKIHGLVAAAVGFDADRGDQLTVENIAFEEPPVEEMVPPGKWQQYGPVALEVGRILGIVVIGVLALFGVIRPMMHGSLSGAARPQTVKSGTVGPRTVQDLEAEMDAQLEAAGASGQRRLPILTRRLGALTQREPENAARLLRTWLTEDER